MLGGDTASPAMRLCVPLFDVSFTDDTKHRLIHDERFALAPRIALVRLADHVAAQMRKWVVGGDAHSLLVWAVEVEIDDLFAATITDRQAVSLVHRIMSLV